MKQLKQWIVDSSESIRILVVEDAPGDVFLIKFYLEELDPDFYELQSVDNLADAHKKLERESFDVVLLDLNLPDSEGMITLKNTIKKFPEEVIIVLTGLSDQKIGIEAVKNGAQDFLIKGRIDSKILDSSIKFSYQRSKLKKAVKFFEEAIKTLENTHDFVVLILNLEESLVYHSKKIDEFFSLEDSDMDSLKDMYDFFGDEPQINQAIENCSDSITKVVHLQNKNVSYQLKFNRSAALKHVVVVSVNKDA